MGFAVFSLNYRPAPQTDLRGQLADVQAALRWIKAHLADYPVNPNAVFLTGDSAGGALTMLTLAIENSTEAAAAFGIDEPSGIGFAGAAPVCGVYSLASKQTADEAGRDSSPQKDSSTTLICRRCSLPPAATIFWRQIIWRLPRPYRARVPISNCSIRKRAVTKH